MSNTPSYKYRDSILNNHGPTIKEWHHLFKPKIIAYIRSNNGNKEDGQEIFSTGISIVCTNISFKPEMDLPDDKFYAYLKRICLNKWMDELKRRNRITELNDREANSRDPLAEILKAESLQDFMSKFRQLGKNCQDLLWKTHVEEMRDRALAEIFGWTEAFVRVKRSRCNKYLKKLMDK